MQTEINRTHIVGVEGDHLLIVFPYEILEKVKSPLDRNRLRYYVDDEVLSVDNGPEKAFITVYDRIAPDELRRILDDPS